MACPPIQVGQWFGQQRNEKGHQLFVLLSSVTIGSEAQTAGAKKHFMAATNHKTNEAEVSELQKPLRKITVVARRRQNVGPPHSSHRTSHWKYNSKQHNPHSTCNTFAHCFSTVAFGKISYFW